MRKISILLVCFIAFLCLDFHELKGQKLVYQVIKGQKVIGEMTVEHKEVQDTSHYNIQSNVGFRLLFAFNVDYTLSETFVLGSLTDGYATSKLNGKLQKHSVVKGDGTRYALNLNGVSSTIDRASISFSIPQLYFSTPPEGATVFSQQFSDFLPIIRIDDNNYELNSPDGKNTYRYEDGVCVEVRVFRTYANFSFKLIDR